MFAITEFTQELGATRVAPGSNRWQDFTRLWTVDYEDVPEGLGLLERVSRAGLT